MAAEAEIAAEESAVNCSFSFIGSFVFDKVSLQQFDATEVWRKAEPAHVEYLGDILIAP